MPDIDDPLVPDIAQTYLKDYEAYWQAAKLYTERYALQQRPEENTLVFLQDQDLEETGASIYNPPPPKPKRADTISLQLSLNSAYNEPYPESESKNAFRLRRAHQDSDEDSKPESEVEDDVTNQSINMANNDNTPTNPATRARRGSFTTQTLNNIFGRSNSTSGTPTTQSVPTTPFTRRMLLSALDLPARTIGSSPGANSKSSSYTLVPKTSSILP
jgi:hypothetical protein